jgi:integrase
MPAKKRFTPTWLKSLLDSRPAEDTTYSEAGRVGFILRHRTGGALVWLVRYQRNGKPVWLTLGEYPAMTLDQAHEAHGEVRKQLAQGLDPKIERERLRIERQRQDEARQLTEAITVRNVIAEWAWHHARRHRKRPREAVRLLRAHLLQGPMKDKPASDITKRDLVLVIDKILARGSTVMANRIRDLTAQVFNFAAMRDLIPSSPAAGLLKKPGGQEQAKERSLNRDEISQFWRGLDDAKTKISLPIRLALKLILVTAQRPGEVAQARFNDVDVAQRLWRIGDNKSDRPHVVPLNDLAIEIIEELRKLANGRPYLLPSVHSALKPAEPISERALSRALRNNHVDEKLFGCEPFTPHDLRRTAATHMTALGIQRLHVGKVLNHSEGGDITAVYDRYSYWDEKQRALAAWEAELRSIIDGKPSKVVPIARASGTGR